MAPNVAPSSDSEISMLKAQVATQLATAEKADPNIAKLAQIMDQPDESIDLAKAEVAIEQMIDPSISEAATLHQIDDLAQTVRARFPQGDATDNEVKAGVLISTLNDAGPWNGFHPYHYDLDNPMGTDPKDKLLSYYLRTRKGNCVSMPILFVVLGQKLGLSVALSTAPVHDFAKLRRDNGQWMNVEATSYGTKSDEHYAQELNISPRALASGIYLQTLNHRGDVLVMADTLMEYYHHHRSADQQLGLTTLVLLHDSKDVQAWIWRGDAYGQMIDERYIKRYGSEKNIPPSERGNFAVLNQNNQMMFRRAEMLGWTEPTAEEKAEYLQMVQRVKAQQKQGG
jgi:regulator of sirC expression with transglutaminase-like and TPR domain